MCNPLDSFGSYRFIIGSAYIRRHRSLRCNFVAVICSFQRLFFTAGSEARCKRERHIYIYIYTYIQDGWYSFWYGSHTGSDSLTNSAQSRRITRLIGSFMLILWSPPLSRSLVSFLAWSHFCQATLTYIHNPLVVSVHPALTPLYSTGRSVRIYHRPNKVGIKWEWLVCHSRYWLRERILRSSLRSGTISQGITNMIATDISFSCRQSLVLPTILRFLTRYI